MTDANLMDADCVHGITWYDCAVCTQPHRRTWDAIWEDVASQVASRSLCSLAQVGAVITDQTNRVVATGYNGPPAGFMHEDLSCHHWCPRGMDKDGGTVFPCMSVHAEANALLSADRSRWQGGTMFVNKHPCWECSKLIANSGLWRLVVRPTKETPEGHHSESTYVFLEQCGLTVEVLE